MFGRAKRDDAAPAEASPAEAAEAAAPAKSRYVTRAECNAMILAAVNAALDAQAIADREIAAGARDAYFGPGRLYTRLREEAESLSKPVARCLHRLVDGMAGKASKTYGVDSSHPGQRWDTA
jgi:hypothetical protein